MNNFRIKEIKENERPMEKLLQYGVNSLSNSELLAILIGSGTKNKNAIYLAEEILKYKIRDKDLLYTSMEQLMEIDGIGLSKASRIISGLELGNRLAKIDKSQNISLSSPDTVAEFLYEYFRDSYKEEFCVLFLDTKNKVIGTQTVSIGTINQSLVHPREVFRYAIMKNSNSILLSHNHPSGDPTPSKEDILITERLIKAGEYIGIKVLDHLVIGDRRYISLRAENLVRGF
ncbi:RadC family protein [Helcococcus kunzii]|uniref:DNA repair protein RadC n=1 Tax=Helcococcus kunzii ATCC 51366 TaxID=883114 RepID=H3NMU4_9FIRM|nr:DNA repair protein RadC [Helcococcus kunzii]EHR34685.1 DNA repair protein RadC [Helcococcus kunzii ATCC 51366]MCT1795339.1 DNA repair protein RadC [Helcococcus kunzii]MCT1989520.1 DNA repair protein RadC [Helcococcus kunzii]QUY64594.1 JAB domain-containing protein [Helcococcus kunzii]QZO77010.1 DNA repair protein RadC [Helcococcus kunzii]